ncbi:MAG: hypothetical protein M5R36_27680 [Deltaproteobacteria bacterium]|nr:hypothetical protein [Deltaproteobacteria bacterium]
MPDIPSQLPTVLADRILLAWEDLDIGEMSIRLEAEFTHRLDASRLARAMDLLLDAEPVLGCRTVFDGKTPFWERLPRGARGNFIEAPDEAAFAAFRDKHVSAAVGPQAEGCLWRAPDGDKFLLRVSHVAADAGGVKEVAARLSEIYTKLGVDPAFAPEPNVAGSRASEQGLPQLSWRGRFRVFFNSLRYGWKHGRRPGPLSLPTWDAAPEHPVDVVRHLPADRVARIAGYGRARRATVNEMLVAAYYRGLARVGGWKPGIPLRLQITVDFRKWYRGGRPAEGICNLSAFDYIHLENKLGANFDETLALVAERSRARKADHPGLVDFGVYPLIKNLSYPRVRAFFAWLLKNMVSKHLAMNTLTNMGAIEPGQIRFDEPAARAWLWSPRMRPPLFGAGVSGYAGSLALTVGATPGTRAVAEKFFDTLLEELPG